MLTPTHILLAAFCIALFSYIIRLVLTNKLLLKYSLLWLALSFAVCLGALFPEPVYALSSLLGFELASNFIFLVAVIFLLAICLSLSVIASKQAAYSKTLIQEIAILKKAYSDTEKEQDDISRAASAEFLP